jgi:two-component system KDP operon response regulator KdpE
MSTPGRVPLTQSLGNIAPMIAPKILLVGADGQVRRALRVTLASAGYAIDEARTGEEALERLQTKTAGQVDLIVLDFELSGIGGQETCRRMRTLVDVPILAMSVFRDPKDKLEASHAGANDYLVKPFGIQELLARMQTLRRRMGALEFLPAV